MRKVTSEYDDTKCNGEVIGWAFLADCGRREIDHDAMTRKVQTCILDSSLDALATLLHGGVWQANYRNARQAVGVVHFNFDDDPFQSDDGTGKYARKHVESVDEVEGKVNQTRL
jgi:hypothetical protein